MSIKKIIKNKMTVKKFIKTKILCLVFFIPVFSYSAWQGAGTQADPWQITSRQCLEALADSVARPLEPMWSQNKYFILMNDITDSVRISIGGNSRMFYGSFDGNGKEITLAINGSNAHLFTILTWGSRVDNLSVTGYVIRTGTGGYGTAGIAGHNYGTITNCINSAKIIGARFTGGICGRNSGVVSNCINIGTVKGNDVVGGISGDIVMLSGGAILNSANYGFVYGVSNFVGGITGVITNNTTASNNFNSGVVVGTSNVGCIVGFREPNAILINNHYDKQMCGEEE